MQNTIVDLLLTQGAAVLDPTPVSPTREEKFLGFLVCKNLRDLCETGESIVLKLLSQGEDPRKFPSPDSIKMYRTFLGALFVDEMFSQNEDGDMPVWKVIENFSSSRAEIATKLYRSIRKNALDGPYSQKIREAITKKDIVFFIEKFDSLFENVPFKETLILFKNLVSYRLGDEIWDFFEILLTIYEDEAQNLEALQDCP